MKIINTSGTHGHLVLTTDRDSRGTSCTRAVLITTADARAGVPWRGYVAGDVDAVRPRGEATAAAGQLFPRRARQVRTRRSAAGETWPRGRQLAARPTGLRHCRRAACHRASGQGGAAATKLHDHAATKLRDHAAGV